jgi:AraC-like DNA-binding protein
MAERVSVGGGATVVTLARGSLATLSSYRHDTEVPHRDPDEERFHRPTLIFTTGGAWEIRSAFGRDRIDPSVVVLGDAGRPYRASHDERIPSDRTMFLELSQPDETASAFGRTTIELFAEVFSRQMVARTREVARLQAALAAHDPDDVFGSLRTDVLSIELVLELAGAAPGAKEARTLRPDTRERVVRARDYLDEHLSDDVDLRTLAREVALSPFHLARSFAQEVGESPHRYLVRRRLDRAAELLVSTPLTVTQVCDRVGFGSPAHFSQSFRRRFGVPPSVYRTLAP